MLLPGASDEVVGGGTRARAWGRGGVGVGVGVGGRVCTGLPHTPVRQQPPDLAVPSYCELLSPTQYDPATQYMQISLIHSPTQFMQDSIHLIARHSSAESFDSPLQVQR